MSSFGNVRTASSNFETEDSAIRLVKHVHFCGPPCCQNWSFSDSLIYYITKNPTIDAYQKMIKSCKFFFYKNPIIFMYELRYDTYLGWRNHLNNFEHYELKNIKYKIWLDGRFTVYSDTLEKFDVIFPLIFPKLQHYFVKYLYLCDVIICYDDFRFLFSSIETLNFRQVTVTNENGTIIEFEKIVENLSEIKEVDIKSEPLITCITSNTVSNLLKLPQFRNLKYLRMGYVSEAFDIDTFYGYMKKNKITSFELYFSATISAAYQARLQLIIDEIISTESDDYKKPYITFHGLDGNKKSEIWIAHYGSRCLFD